MKIFQEEVQRSGPFTIQLTVDRTVLEKLRQEVGLKKICGNFYGVQDEFILLILEAWVEDKQEIHIINKEKSNVKKRRKTGRRKEVII